MTIDKQVLRKLAEAALYDDVAFDEFIANVSPTVFLSILDEIDELKIQIDELKMYYDELLSDW